MDSAIKRILTTLAAVFLTASLCGQAQAFTVTGGTQDQRSTIREAISSTAFPPVSWVDSRFQGGVTIHIVDHFGTYWETGPVELDVFLNIVGAAQYGNIYILDTLVPSPWLGEVAIHEWCHEVWFALPIDANVEWNLMAVDGFPEYDPSIWLENSVENHAENLRVRTSDPSWMSHTIARTRLRRFSRDFVWEWHAKWIPEMTTTTVITTTTTVIEHPTTTTTTSPPPPPTTTTTTVRGDPFPDVSRDDSELWEAAWWASDAGFIFGFHDGTFGPYLPLTHRQLATIVDRWIGLSLTGYMSDWSPVTRAETRAALPNLTWNEDRGTEPLTRSQLVRLMWRAR